MAMTVGRRIVVGFAVPLLLLASVTAVGYLALQRLTGQLQKLTALQEELLGSSRAARSGVRDAERALLDYLLTGNSERLRARSEQLTFAENGLNGIRKSPVLETPRIDSVIGEF